MGDDTFLEAIIEEYMAIDDVAKEASFGLHDWWRDLMLGKTEFTHIVIVRVPFI